MEIITIIWGALCALVASITNEITGSNVVVGLAVVALLTGALTNRPTYGTEIEVIRKRRFLPNHRSLSNWLRRWTGRQVVYEGYTHDYIHTLKVVSDGSLNNNGSEVVMPVTQQGDYSLLRKVLNGLRGLASADASCGLHVHIGLLPEAGQNYDYLNDDDAVEVVSWLYRILVAYDHFCDALCGVLAPSRRRSQWAEKPSSQLARVTDMLSSRYDIDLSQHKTITHALGKAAMNADTTIREVANRIMYQMATGRYWAVNCDAMLRYGTVEFRQHGGTTHPTHAINWVKLMDKLVATCREPFLSNVRQPANYVGSSITAMCDWLGIHPNATLRNHWLRRKARFAGILLAGQRCSQCESSECDGDEYCPSKEYSTPEGYNRRDHYTGGDNRCGYCGYDGYDCECGSVSLVGMLGLLFAPIIALVGCGVGAYHWASQPRKVKGGLKRLWIGLTSRGKDSAGLAFRSPKRDPNTGEPSEYRGMWVHKAPAPANAMTSVENKFILPETPVILMHTRLATNGEVNKVNAHPHRDPQGLGITLVHNGVITNDPKVFKALNVKPETDCDSEAAAACLAAGGIESVVKHCIGSMSLIWTDDRVGQQVLNFWTNGGNPLAFGRLDDAKTGAVVVASTQGHLTKAFRKRLKSCYDAAIGKHYTVSANGVIESRNIKGSEKSAGWYRYVYRSYPTKIKGTKGKTVTTDSLNDNDEFHTWMVDEHQGQRPDGSTYNLPQYLDPSDPTDVAEVEEGRYDPTHKYDAWMSGDYWDYTDNYMM